MEVFNEHPITHFESGRLVLTPNISQVLDAATVHSCVVRHLYCDWGDVSDADWQTNNLAVASGVGRIVSRYRISGTMLQIITDADRTVTTLLPQEY